MNDPIARHLTARPILWALLAPIALLWAEPSPARAQCECPASDTIVIGHRGAGSDGADEPQPENTIESAQLAFEEGADMVEVDVQLTSDGAAVLMHDDTVDRTTDGTGCVSALTLAEVRELRAGGVSVPTLEELLAAVDGDVNVEVKLHEGTATECPAQDLDALADAVVSAIGADTKDRTVLVSSFDLSVLQRIRTADATIPIGYLTTDPADIGVASAEGFEAIHMLAIVANARVAGRARDAGLQLNVWTVNGDAAVRDALSVDVDGVITDTAAQAVAARAAYCDEYVCPGADAGAAPDAGASPDDSGGCHATSHSAGRGSGWAWILAAALALSCRRRRSVR